MDKLRVGVIFGGRSSEHEISLRSALSIISALDQQLYEVVPIGIVREGQWFLVNDPVKTLSEAVEIHGELRNPGTPVVLPAEPGGRLLELMPDSRVRRETKLNVIFPVLHGTFGEDGAIQGLLEMAAIPYVGSGVLGSALGMEKDAQKMLLRASGVPTVRFAAIERSEYERDPGRSRAVAEDLGFPVFVKPNALGSSIGISRIKRPADLARALEDAFRYDRKVLIEAACEGREFECSVLGNEDPQASLPGEIVIGAGHDFYSYESKYMDPHGANFHIPAKLPLESQDRIRRLSVQAFKALGLRGMARVDFLASPGLDQIYVGEVNTIPGFTSISMYPKLWEVSGLGLPRLLDRLIELALQEHQQRQNLAVSYRPKG